MKSAGHKPWTWASLGLLAICVTVSVALGRDVRLISLLVLPPLVAGLTTTPRRTALIATLSVAAAIALGFAHEATAFTTSHTMRVVVVALAAALAVQTAILRQRDLRTRRRLALINAARDQLEAASGIEDALASLGRAAIVAEFAEWSILDIKVPDGSQIRLVERGESSDALDVVPLEGPTAATEAYEQEVLRDGPALLRAVPDALITGLFGGTDLRELRHVHAIVKHVTVGELSAVYFFICPDPTPPWGEAELTQIASLARAAAERARSDQLIDKITHTQQELRESRDEVSAIVGGIASGIIAQRPDGEIVYANDVAARMLDWSDAKAMIGSSFREVLDRIVLRNEDGSPFDEADVPSRRALRGEDSPTALLRYITKSTGEEMWMFVRSTAIFGDNGEPVLAIAVVEDNTERKRNEMSQRFLADASQMLSRSLDFDSALETVARAAVPAIADWCTIELAGRGGAIETVAVAHKDPEREAAVRKFRDDFPLTQDDDFGPAIAIRTGEPQLYQKVDLDTARAVYEDEARAHAVAELSPRSSLTAPITVRGEPFGAIMLALTGPGASFTDYDLATVVELGRRAGIAIDNARLHTERMRMLSSLQQSLIPAALPKLDGIELSAAFRPAERDAQVSGDFYDAFRLSDGSSALVIGDVCGKGPEAAALTALARYTIRAAAMDESDPKVILSRLNDALIEQVTDGRFCTVAIVRVTRSEDGLALESVSAGHPLPLITGTGPARPVGAPGTLLGVVEHPDLPLTRETLLPAESLVLYTDGLSAGQTTDDTSYALALLNEISLNGSGDSAQLINRAAIDRQAEPNRDDVAILVARAEQLA
ncbi:MAG: SpoIIE family protein phosphatase [Solirubrobacterales bacterium]